MNILRVNSNHCLNAPKRNPKTVFCHRLATHFEDLSNELLLDIFDFLDGYHVFEAFSNLNNRIQHLITSSYFSLKLNISFMSKSNFNRRSNNIIRPYMNQIISLQLSESFFIKNFFTSLFSDTSFNRLESLVLNDLNVDDDVSILNSLAQLPRLFSLKIFCYECNELFFIFQSIFRLPVLQYAKILYSNWTTTVPFPLATSDNQRSMTLEYLTVDSPHHLTSIYNLLSYTPRLRRLSVESIFDTRCKPLKQFIQPRNLTSISLCYWDLSFDKFASFIAIVGSELEFLRISIKHPTALSNVYQWQQLILRHMPRLRTFLFDYHGPLTKDAHGNSRCRTLLDEFASPFWIERQWFFAHSHCDCFSQEEEKECVSFYSTQMRRREFCLSDESLDNNICLYQDPVFYLSFGPRIGIKSQNIDANFSFQFPYVTELEITDNYYRINMGSFIDNLSHIFILTNITYLKIPLNNQLLHNFVKLLNRIPNIQKLVLDVRSSSKMEVSSDQQTNTVDLVCNNNVRDVQITGELTLATIRLINKLFPRMECLRFLNRENALIPFVRILLSNRTNNNHLFSLVFNGDDAMIKQLKTMIDNEKLLDNYNIEDRQDELCLWW
ncbi:unnamed protein product [Adineta steineri]|uniref:F-box domain-containing protein n=1 Tax=Adineta steineri TaxID=433720 RepID=A0A813QZH8_9BILA|nr:unnamed protein product [Adineta steineri]CAF1197538.1 unnamed protein product [Adineta steineri]CAF1283087.1 unnamed protein product [Adineta steineri]